MTAQRGVATTNSEYALALARAAVGALIFGLPLVMTMEMWSLGYEMDSASLLLLTAANLVFLIGLSRVSGFEESQRLLDDVLDALSAYFVAVVAASALLFLVGAIGPGDHAHDVIAKIAVQAVPGSFGAMIGAKLMGEGDDIEQQERWRESYTGTLFLMLAGALFLSLNVAPTEETSLIAYQMSGWHTLAMAILSLLILHILVYQIEVRGQSTRKLPPLQAFLRFTVPGFAISILACSFVLWCFGHIDADPVHAVRVIAVLTLPAAIGAAIGRIAV